MSSKQNLLDVFGYRRSYDDTVIDHRQLRARSTRRNCSIKRLL
jgi:hypothetical protein